MPPDEATRPPKFLTIQNFHPAKLAQPPTSKKLTPYPPT